MTRLGQKALTASLTSIYKCPNGTQTEVKSISLCNTTAGSVNVSLCIVPDGKSADATTAIMWSQPIPANKTVGIECSESMTTDDVISASGLDVTITINGEERRI